eukprot:scaffold54507_cov30-Tisochrysis_lutea.AAC.2
MTADRPSLSHSFGRSHWRAPSCFIDSDVGAHRWSSRNVSDEYRAVPNALRSGDAPASAFAVDTPRSPKGSCANEASHPRHKRSARPAASPPVRVPGHSLTQAAQFSLHTPWRSELP